MKINISDIVKVDGGKLNIEFEDAIEDLDAAVKDFVFEKTVKFKGNLTNIAGILKLDGNLTASYSTNCYKCLDETNGVVDIPIKEEFVTEEDNAEGEAYTYEGNHVSLDKVLKDSIILNLPMKQACSEECSGLCPKCGVNLNSGSCQCQEEVVNPRMAALKDFFKDGQ